MSAILYLPRLGEGKRRQRSRLYAERRGWEYLPTDRSLVRAFESPPFGVRRHGRATNAMRGVVRGREFVAFDFHCVNGAGLGRPTEYFAVCAVRIPGRLPVVRLRSENPVTRAATVAGSTDVEVESEAFNRRWHVSSHDVRATRAILTPRMIDRLLASDLIWKAVIFEPGFVLVYTDGPSGGWFNESMLDTVCDIADLVPGFLAEDYP
ncbi:MAG: DUF3137 domain-containing protein [Actinobacteria bacterium]|nr:DUF3137 domain-containing protein [Actinomycetota bacterium]